MYYQEAWDALNEYAYNYNHQRLHAGINYLRPADMYFGRGQKILRERATKLKSARELHKTKNIADKQSSFIASYDSVAAEAQIM